MPPRITRAPPSRLRTVCLSLPPRALLQQRCSYAAVAQVPVTPAPTDQNFQAVRPIARFPPTQPPSHKPPTFRKSQLHRQYQSLIRSSPLMLIFQHNNLKAVEYMGIRRELAAALRTVDETLGLANTPEAIAPGIKLNIVQTGIFASALRVVEFYDPVKGSAAEEAGAPQSTNPQVDSSAPLADASTFTHGLSERAWQISHSKAQRHGLEPLLSGPLAILSFPTVTPQHLKAALQILAPHNPDFPAPKRRTNPSYHEPAVQLGLQKLMLLGARVEGKAFDFEGARWVGSIPGGLEGLRAQLVAMLQGFGAGLTGALEGASRSLWFTLENRKAMMEEEEKGGKEGATEEGKVE